MKQLKVLPLVAIISGLMVGCGGGGGGGGGGGTPQTAFNFTLLRQRHKRFQVTVLVRFTIALSQTTLSKY